MRTSASTSRPANTASAWRTCGRDWVTASSYRFTGCQVLDRPNVLVCGMKSEPVAVLWLQNRESSWYNHARDTVLPVDAFRLAVRGLSDGPYDVEWWDTWQGEPIRTEQIKVRDGTPALDGAHTQDGYSNKDPSEVNAKMFFSRTSLTAVLAVFSAIPVNSLAEDTVTIGGVTSQPIVPWHARNIPGCCSPRPTCPGFGHA